MSRRCILAFVVMSGFPGCGGSVLTTSESTNELKGFVIAGQMTEKRYGHYSILLLDGRVLTGGGATTDGSGQERGDFRS